MYSRLAGVPAYCTNKKKSDLSEKKSLRPEQVPKGELCHVLVEQCVRWSTRSGSECCTASDCTDEGLSKEWSNLR